MPDLSGFLTFEELKKSNIRDSCKTLGIKLSSPEDARRRHFAQGLVVAPVVVVADEGDDGRLQI